MNNKTLRSGLISFSTAVFMATPVLFQGLSTQAQVASVDGRFEEYSQGITPTLAYGVNSPSVQDLQIFMDELGYYNGSIDGRYDDQVVGAVEAFQTDYGLVADGVVGANTWDSILSIDPDSIFEPEDNFNAATDEYFDYEDDYAYNSKGLDF